MENINTKDLACRLCLKIVQKDSSIYHKLQQSSTLSQKYISLKEKISDCIPELILDNIDDDIICHVCFTQLEKTYLFKQRCLDTQNKIYGYLQQMPIDTEMNIIEIAGYYNRLEIAEGGSSTEPHLDGKVNASTTTEDLHNNAFLDNVFSFDDQDEELELAEMNEVEDVNFQSAERSVSWSNSVDDFGNSSIHEYECLMCEFKSKDMTEYRVHVILHAGKAPPFQCDECSTLLDDKFKLIRHIGSHCNASPIICECCDYFTTELSKYLKHKSSRSHRESRNRCPKHRCAECKLIFRNPQQLQTHHRRVHEIKKRILYCELCTYVATSENILRTHLQKEHGESSTRTLKKTYRLKCKICPTEYNTHDELEAHLRWHSADKEVFGTCTICGERCKSRKQLRKHITRYHRTCNICKSEFPTHVVLKRHLEEIHHK